MKKLLSALFAVLALTVSCRRVDLSHGSSDGVVAIGEENVTYHSAKLKGRLTILEPAAKEVGIIYARKGQLKTASSPRIDCGPGTEYFWGTADNLDPDTEYEYLAYRIVGKKEYYSAKVSFKTPALPEHAVDMGLPSGRLWRDCNLGADSPSERGAYYAWGETGSKSNFTETGYKFYDSSLIIFNKYSGDGGYNTDGKRRLYQYDYVDDAARHSLDGTWRVPSMADWEELTDTKNCYINWEKESGIWGFMVRSNINDNRLFFPVGGYMNGTSMTAMNSEEYEAQGYYWMDEVYCRRYNGCWENQKAQVLNFRYSSNGDKRTYRAIDMIFRYYGALIRPVCE